MTIRRFLSIAAVATVPLGLIGCSNSDELSEPSMSEVMTTAEAAEASSEGTAEKSSTTVTTISEEAAGGDTGPCDWKPVEEGTPGEIVSTYCDGKHAQIGTYASDHVVYAYWDGKEWINLPKAGTSYTGFSCYDKGEVERLGFPIEITENMLFCD